MLFVYTLLLWLLLSTLISAWFCWNKKRASTSPVDRNGNSTSTPTPPHTTCTPYTTTSSHSLPLHLSPSSHDFQSALPSTMTAQWSTDRGPGSVQNSPSQTVGWATLTLPTPGRGRGSTTSLGEPLGPLCLSLLSYTLPPCLQRGESRAFP